MFSVNLNHANKKHPHLLTKTLSSTSIAKEEEKKEEKKEESEESDDDMGFGLFD